MTAGRESTMEEKGSLGRHIRRTSSRVDSWPASMKPAYTKSAPAQPQTQRSATSKSTPSRSARKSRPS